MTRIIDYIKSNILILIFIFTFSPNGFAIDLDKSPRKEVCGFEWVHVIYRDASKKSLCGAQTKSGDWIVPLTNSNITFREFKKGGKNFGFFEVTKEMKNGDWTSSLFSPYGDELISAGRYGMFFWSENRIVGTGPDDYETINIDLDKLLIRETLSNSDLNMILIGSWKNGLDSLWINNDHSFTGLFDTLFLGFIDFSGHWSISGQTIKFENGNTSVKYQINVISTVEIELIHIDGATSLFKGKWKKTTK